MSTEVRGTEVFDGETKIADIIREANKFAASGYTLCFVPVGDKSWRQYMGDEIDHERISEMFACSICSGCASASFNEPTKSRLIEQHICFSCDHWLQIIKNDAAQDKQRAVVTKGKHYYMGKNTTGPHRWSGFGGHEFNILFNDGREVKCNNLWSQGEIPEHFRDRLPDNATFVPALVGKHSPSPREE